MAAPEPGIVEKAKSGIAGLFKSTTDSAKSLLGIEKNPVVSTPDLAVKVGAGKEPAGMTITGGRRYRKKTEKRRSKKRKTMRRKH